MPTERPLYGKNDNKATDLQACQGDCDGDWQCAPGLACFQRSHGEHVPGCIDNAKAPADYDYCYDPWYATDPVYIKLKSGTCDDYGLAAVTTVSECAAAAKAIGNADDSPEITSNARLPEGCYVYRTKELFLATNPANRGNGAQMANKRFPICRTKTKGPCYFLCATH